MSKIITAFTVDNFPEIKENDYSYKDFFNKKLTRNQSTVYIENNQFLIGIIVLQDMDISIKNEDITLKDYPFIKTVKNSLIPVTNKNAIGL